MKQEFKWSDIPPHWYVFAFYFWLASSILYHPTTRIGVEFNTLWGWSDRAVSGTIGLGLLVTSVLVLVIAPRTLRGLLALAIPLVLYLLATGGIVQGSPDRPAGGEVIAFMAAILVFAVASLQLSLQMEQKKVEALSEELTRLTKKPEQAAHD